MNLFSDDHLKSYICTHVFENVRPILLVSHEEDGSWCFLCGDNHENVATSYRVVGIGHLIDRDSSLNDCSDLSIGWEAERIAIGAPWLRIKSETEAC